MAQGDLPTPRGGSLRRRREKRQLQQLAESSERKAAPGTAVGHVKVVEDQSPAPTGDQAEAMTHDPEAVEADAPLDGSPPRTASGFHVRAVPIDQPIGE